MVPAMMKMILDHPQSRKTNYSTIKYISYGASPIPLDLLKEAIEVFQCGFIQLYGMTETTGSVTYLPPEDHSIEGNERMKSAGKALPHCEIRIVDENNNEVPRREVGEIIVKTTSNMLGYWNLPEETTKTLKAGWLHSGDGGYMDEDGYVYVHEAINDDICYNFISNFLDKEVIPTLPQKNGFDLEGYKNKVLKRFKNSFIEDKLLRTQNNDEKMRL